MPKVSSEHIDRRRERILRAAFRCFSRKGFHRTTMREICREAGLSLGGVYCHFESKDEIIQALARRGRGETRSFFDRVPRGESALETLRTLMAKLIGSLEFEECLEAARLDIRLWGEALHDEQIRALFLQGFENVRRPIIELIEEAKREGRVEAGASAEAAGRILVALQLGLSLQKAVDPKAETKACAALVGTLLDGLRAGAEEET